MIVIAREVVGRVFVKVAAISAEDNDRTVDWPADTDN